MRINNSQTNELIAKFAGNHVHYLDIGPLMLNAKGELTQDIMPDLLHPNAKGYHLWAAAVAPEITKTRRAVLPARK